MNEYMASFLKAFRKQRRIYTGIIKFVEQNPQCVFHPTVVTKKLVDKLHETHSEVLQVAEIWKFSVENTDVVAYVAVLSKRFGRTYTPRLFVVFDRSLNVLHQNNFYDRTRTIISHIAITLSNI